MPETTIIADKILERLRTAGVAHSITGRSYEYVEDIPDGVRISRETGVEWDINRQHLADVIDAIREEPNLYNAGPNDLKPYINAPVRSVIWALIHLLPLDVIS